MSASLVGSEMCIRDRAARPHEGPFAPGPGSRGPENDRFRGSGRGSKAATVSYTHLTLPTICSV
eukprot:13704172-Alexandrium_andersonii.AAC.1